MHAIPCACMTHMCVRTLLYMCGMYRVTPHEWHAGLVRTLEQLIGNLFIYSCFIIMLFQYYHVNPE